MSREVGKRYALIAVDLQNDFAAEGGKLYSPKPCLLFLRSTLFPYLESSGMQISEIVSDYRQPRPGYTKGCCEPGQWGHDSIVPAGRTGSRLVKSMNSPVWTRENIGEADGEPGRRIPTPSGSPRGCELRWGTRRRCPGSVGLTVDCCVLCVAQELSWRGYETLVLREGVDCPSGKPDDRDTILATTVQNWAGTIVWQQLMTLLDHQG